MPKNVLIFIKKLKNLRPQTPCLGRVGTLNPNLLPLVVYSFILLKRIATD